METVGQYLKRERELRNISLNEIATATRIRENLLAAIEEDRHDLLPAPVFVKGFLVAYGKHIGLDPGDVVLRYESDLKELLGHEEKGPPAQEKKGWKRGFLLGTIIVVVGIGIILFNPWKEPKEREEQAPVHVEETPIVQENFIPPPVVPEQEDIAPPVEETIVVREAPPAETPPEPLPETTITEMMSEPKEMDLGSLILHIQAIEETWIALQVDSDLPWEITLRAGETFSQHANNHIKLKIGNAGGVNLTFNGKDLGSLGDPGKIVRLSLTQKGYEFKKRDDFEIPGYGDEVKPPNAH
jgi:cytoskeleton protein RodZ